MLSLLPLNGLVSSPHIHCIPGTTCTTVPSSPLSLYSPSQACAGDRRSELLPAGWSDNKELYSLRYQGNNSEDHILLKAITADSSLIFNLMVG